MEEKLKEGHVPEPAPVTIAVFPFTLKGCVFGGASWKYGFAVAIMVYIYA
jgi:hypothetical protein